MAHWNGTERPETGPQRSKGNIMEQRSPFQQVVLEQLDIYVQKRKKMNLYTDLIALYLPFLYPCPPNNLLLCLRIRLSSRAMGNWGKVVNWSSWCCILCVFCLPLISLGCFRSTGLKRGCLRVCLPRCRSVLSSLGSFCFRCSTALSTKGFPDDHAKAYCKGNGSLSTVPGTSQVLSKYWLKK